MFFFWLLVYKLTSENQSLTCEHATQQGQKTAKLKRAVWLRQVHLLLLLKESKTKDVKGLVHISSFLPHCISIHLQIVFYRR